MRKLIAILCLMALLVAGCASAEPKDISCYEIAEAYKAAGYGVFHNHDAGYENNPCCIKAYIPETEEAIFIDYYDTPEAAKEIYDQRQYNVVIWLFSVIYGDPMWVYTELYGNYEIEYTNKELYEPFEKLIG